MLALSDLFSRGDRGRGKREVISFGIAESRGGVPPRSLMDEADVRLYEAGGRNLVVA